MLWQPINQPQLCKRNHTSLDLPGHTALYIKKNNKKINKNLDCYLNTLYVARPYAQPALNLTSL